MRQVHTTGQSHKSEKLKSNMKGYLSRALVPLLSGQSEGGGAVTERRWGRASWVSCGLPF